MTENIRRIQYTGIENVPDVIRKRVLTGDVDQRVIDKRGPVEVSGATVPARTRMVEIFDAHEPTREGEHVLYAAINRGKGSVTSIVSISGPSPEAARWHLGNKYNLKSLQDAYGDHKFVPSIKVQNDPTFADGGY